MIVCVCHRVSDRAIAAAVHDGCCPFEQLQAQLRTVEAEMQAVAKGMELGVMDETVVKLLSESMRVPGGTQPGH